MTKRIMVTGRATSQVGLLLMLMVGSLASRGADFVISRVYEGGFYPGVIAVAACRFGEERAVTFMSSSRQAGLVIVHEKDQDNDIAPTSGNWIAIKCPDTPQADALAVSSTEVLRSRNGVSWESVFRLGKEKITAAAFFGETIFLATDKNQVVIGESGHWRTLPLRVEGQPYGIHFSSRQKGTLWVKTQKGIFDSYWTADGGKTWSPAALSMLQGAASSRFGSMSVGFFDKDYGIAIAYYDVGRHTLYRLIVTRDGGKAWVPLAGEIDAFGMQFEKIIRLDKDRLLVTSNHGLYVLKAGSDQLAKLAVRGAEFAGHVLKELYEGTSGSMQDGDVLIMADDPPRYVLVGRVKE